MYSYCRFSRKRNKYYGLRLDIMIISSNKSFLVHDKSFMGYFRIVCNSKIEYYRACTSIRVWYQDENEIEF